MISDVKTAKKYAAAVANRRFRIGRTSGRFSRLRGFHRFAHLVNQGQILPSMPTRRARLEVGQEPFEVVL
jgi:hypothetical protein